MRRGRRRSRRGGCRPCRRRARGDALLRAWRSGRRDRPTPHRWGGRLQRWPRFARLPAFARGRRATGSCERARRERNGSFDRGNFAQMRWDRARDRGRRDAGQRRFPRSPSGAGQSSDRKERAEHRHAQRAREDQSATAHARVRRRRIEPRAAHHTGQTIGAVPVGLRHASTRTGNLARRMLKCVYLPICPGSETLI